MNKKQIEYIKKHNAKIAKKEIQKRMDSPTFAKCQNVIDIYKTMPSLRKRIEREG